MSNRKVDKLIDRIPKKNKYMVTTEEVVNYIFILENRIEKAVEYIEQNEFYLDYKSGACIKGVMPLLNILNGKE